MGFSDQYERLTHRHLLRLSECNRLSLMTEGEGEKDDDHDNKEMSETLSDIWLGQERNGEGQYEYQKYLKVRIIGEKMLHSRCLWVLKCVIFYTIFVAFCNFFQNT